MEVINLNLIPSGALPVVHASQYDEGRTFRANLMDGSTVYTLDGTEVLECDVKKPDGNIVTVAVTNTSDSYVEIDTTLQMCACAGESLAELHITKGAQEIGTLNFILAVERSPLEGGIQSDSGIHNLQTQIGEAVADQYDAADVVFDAVPTAGHGVGFAVTSEGVKNAIPDELDDLSDVTTSAPSSGEALVWDGSKWTNGTPDMDVSDLADVTITTPSDDDILVYQNGEWVNMANPASTANFGADYDENTTYNTGDKCVYNNLLYECNDDGVTGAWDATKWDSLTVASMTDNNLPHFSGTPTAGSTAEAIGDLTTLTTTDKSSLVGAVNEVDGKIKNYSTTGAVAQICTIGSYYQSKIGHICSFEIEITLTSNAVFNTTIVSIPVIPKLTNVPILAYSPDLGSNVNLIIDLDGNIRAISNINSGIKLRIAGTILV